MKKRMLLISTLFLFINLSVSAPPIKFSEKYKRENLYRYLENEKEKEKRLELQRYLSTFALRESGSNPGIINTLGYCGKYQFGYYARKVTGFGHITLEEFRKNPEIWPEEKQDTAMFRLLELNAEYLKDEILFLEQNTLIIKGIVVTKSGILGAAHLGGANGAKKFIETKGAYDPSDAYGTKLSDYVIKFANFNI